LPDLVARAAVGVRGEINPATGSPTLGNVIGVEVLRTCRIDS